MAATTATTNGAAATNGTAPSPNGFVKKPAVDVSVALAPNNLPAVDGILKDISSLSAATVDGDRQSRIDLAEKARDLVRALETPRETMVKHCYSQVRGPTTPSPEISLLLTVWEAWGVHRVDRGYRVGALHCPC